MLRAAVEREIEIIGEVLMKTEDAEISKSVTGDEINSLPLTYAGNGLRNPTAFTALQAVAAGKRFRGVVVYPLVRGAHEVLLGVSRDPQFGPVVAFGLGGIYAEVMHDIVLRIAPLERAEAAAMIREIRAFPILDGARGQARSDLDGLAAAIVALSRLPLRYPEIEEVDLNPVFLRPDGLLVGDARVIRKGQEAQ